MFSFSRLNIGVFDTTLLGLLRFAHFFLFDGSQNTFSSMVPPRLPGWLTVNDKRSGGERCAGSFEGPRHRAQTPCHMIRRYRNTFQTASIPTRVLPAIWSRAEKTDNLQRECQSFQTRCRKLSIYEQKGHNHNVRQRNQKLKSS